LLAGTIATRPQHPKTTPEGISPIGSGAAVYFVGIKGTGRTVPTTFTVNLASRVMGVARRVPLDKEGTFRTPSFDHSDAELPAASISRYPSDFNNLHFAFLSAGPTDRPK